MNAEENWDWTTAEEWSTERFESWIRKEPQRFTFFEDILPFIKEIGKVSVKHDKKLTTILRKGEASTKDLYILLQGNVLLYATAVPFNQLPPEELIVRNKLNIARIGQRGSFGRFILCPGDLIGEYELLGSSSYVSTVLSGVPFFRKAPRTWQETKIMKISYDHIRDKSAFEKIIHNRRNIKIQAVELLSAAKCEPEPYLQLGHILLHCLEGYIPVMGFETKDDNRSICETGLIHCPPHISLKSVYMPIQYLQFLIHPTEYAVLTAMGIIKSYFKHDKVDKNGNIIVESDVDNKKKAARIFKFSLNKSYNDTRNWLYNQSCRFEAKYK